MKREKVQASMRSSIHYYCSALLLLCFALSACGGGSSAPDPDPDPTPAVLTVIDVFPKALSARSGSSVRFIAQTSAQASSYAWDFGAGATPSTSTDFQPLVVLGDPGTYTATLTVCAADCATPFTFTYTVGPNAGPSPGVRILEVTPSGLIGVRGDDVTMRAIVEGEVDQWLWDFGEGVEFPTSTEATPTIHLVRPGFIHGTVSAKLSGGGEDAIAFAYQIGEGIDEAPPVIDPPFNPDRWICDEKIAAFNAKVYSDFPITYEWSFPPGFAPSISTNSIARIATPHEPGVYTATLRVRNQFGQSAPVSQQFTVAECPDTTLTLLEDAPVPRGVLWVNRMTEGLMHEPKKFELQDHPAEQLGSTWGSSMDLLYVEPAETAFDLLGFARRFRFWGAGDYGRVTLPARTPPVVSPPTTVFEFPAPQVTSQSTLALQGDKLVVVLKEHNNPKLWYWISRTGDPQDSSDWDKHTLPGGLISGNDIVEPLWSPGDGRPLVYCLWQSSQDERTEALYVAATANPGATADWSLVPLDIQPSFREPRLPVVREDGGLAIATPLDSVTLQLRNSTSGHPSSEADFVTFSLPIPPSYEFDAMSDWNGRLQLCMSYRSQTSFPNFWFDSTKISSATTAFPAAATDFISYQLPEGPAPLSVASTHGSWMLKNDQVLWVATGFSPISASIYWTTDPAPDRAGDWAAGEPIALFPTFQHIADAPAPDGRWAFLQEFNDTAFLWRGLTPNPISASDWQLIPLLDLNGRRFSINVSSSVYSPTSDRLYFAENGDSDNPGIRVCSITLDW